MKKLATLNFNYASRRPTQKIVSCENIEQIEVDTPVESCGKRLDICLFLVLARDMGKD